MPFKDPVEKARYTSKYNRRKVLERRLAAIALLGGACASCGADDYRVLQIDHINDDGNKDSRSMRKNLAWHVLTGKRGTEDLQLLCANCHSIKTWYGER